MRDSLSSCGCSEAEPEDDEAAKAVQVGLEVLQAPPLRCALRLGNRALFHRRRRLGRHGRRRRHRRRHRRRNGSRRDTRDIVRHRGRS